MTQRRIRAPLGAALLLALGALAGCEEGPPPSASPGGGAQAAPPTEVVPFEPLPATLQRLTRAQYHNIIRDLFGGDLVPPARLEPDVAQAGFYAVGASRTAISPRGVEQYESAAYDVAEQAIHPSRRGRWIPCTPSGPADAECARATLAPLARLAWRRPIRTDELDALVALTTDAGRALDDFHEGLVFAVARLFQSPEFLFRSELGEPDDETPGQRRYTSLEMASRLAFFLWNSAPDEALLAAGEAGELVTDAGIARHAARLLSDPRSRGALRNFFVEHLGLGGLDELTKDPKVFSHASPDLGPAAREETLRTMEHLVFTRNTDFREIFTTRTTFIDRRLAALYDVPAPAETGFGQLVLAADGPRAGLLGQASILASNAHAVSSSATLRGSFVRRVILCDTIPPPPADVDTSLPEASHGAPTLRERIATHASNATCAGCHALLDPIGLGLEQFDGVGRFRTHETGARIDPTGDVDGVPYNDGRELGEVLRESPKIGPCLVRRMYRYATGHEETPGEAAEIDRLSARFAESGHRVQALLTEVVLSPGFRTTADPAEGNP